jgi:VWFA-related protein
VSVRASVASAILCATVLSTLSAQQSQPTFHSTVDLLTLEASVRDKTGAVVAGLTPADFTVKVDGQPRRVVFARLFEGGAAAAVTSGAVAPRFVSTEDAKPGRVIIFVVDPPSIQAGQEKVMLDASTRLLDRLGPEDAAGLIVVNGPNIDLTRDHPRIAEGLKSAVGQWTPPRYAVSFEESVAFERNDTLTIQRVYARECRVSDADCPAEVAKVAKEVRDEGRMHARVLLSALESVLKHLEPLRAPRQIVLLSGGVSFDEQLVGQYKEFEQAAQQARVEVHAVQIQGNRMEASQQMAPNELAFGDAAMKTGLSNLATMSGGLFFSGTGKATGIFDRLASEVTTFYQLAVDTAPDDANGKPHKIDIIVNRPGADVRTLSQIVVAKPQTSAAQALQTALEQPTDVSDLPFAVSTYTTYSQTAGKVRLLVSAAITPSSGETPAQWGFVITQDGKGVAQAGGEIPPESERPRIVSTGVDLAPGSYRLRVGAVDSAQRIGTLDVPISVGFATAADTQLGDLIIGDAASGALQPRPSLAQDQPMTARLDAVGALGADDVKGVMQMVRAGTAQSDLDVPLTAHTTADGTHLSLQGTGSLAGIPPGRYTAMAVIFVQGHAVARVNRVVDVVAGSAAAAPAAARPSPSRSSPNAATGASMDPAAAPIMERVASYVDAYGTKASVIIAIEHYTQEAVGMGTEATQTVTVGRLGAVKPSGPPSVTTRTTDVAKEQLVSELALVRNAAAVGGWLGYRDVTERNGKSIGDHHDRLAQLFSGSQPDLETAKKITQESARYNVGSVTRTFNVPTSALFFFNSGDLHRFTLKLAGTEKVGGADATKIEFRETARPTMIGTRDGRDVPCEGILWVTPQDGSVLRTQLTVADYSGKGSRAVIDVFYESNAQMGMPVPVRMEERYNTSNAQVTATATYSDFKKFQTSAVVKVK